MSNEETYPAVTDILPHRPPMLLVDVIEDLSDTHILASRLVRSDEIFFAGHFPDRPVLPGVFILEALAQSAAFLTLTRVAPEIDRSQQFLGFAGADKVRFKNAVGPDTRIEMRADLLWARRGVYRYKGTVTANSLQVLRTEFSAMTMHYS